MAFAQTSIGDTSKAGLLLHLLNGCSASVAHRLTETTDQLIDQRTKHPLIWNTSLDAFSNNLRLFHAVLKVAIFAIAALFHSPNRTHAAIIFETLPVRDDQFTG